MKQYVLHLVFPLCLLFGASLLTAGTTGKISGKVLDAETNEALPGANVTVEGTNMGDATDLQGE